MLVDEVSRRHLELVISSDGTRRGSLLSVLDETLTPVGARALQNWIVYPLLDLDAICARHDAVEELFETDLKVGQYQDHDPSVAERVIESVTLRSALTFPATSLRICRRLLRFSPIHLSNETHVPRHAR